MMQAGRTLLKGAIFMVAAVALASCSMFKADDSGQSRADDNAGRGGGGFLGIGGGGGNRGASDEGIGVNSYDTLNFMPLQSADPFGGVIITDWYSAPTTPNERFKATVYILDTRLRADALNVSIFRQTNAGGSWSDASVDPETENQIWNPVLHRPRELRLSNVRQTQRAFAVTKTLQERGVKRHVVQVQSPRSRTEVARTLGRGGH